MQSVQVQEQQQQQTVQSPQAKPEVSNIPTFLSEDTDRLDEEEVPEEISNRILSRILVFAGLPTFLGMLSLPLFYYLKVHALGLPLTCLDLPAGLNVRIPLLSCIIMHVHTPDQHDD